MKKKRQGSRMSIYKKLVFSYVLFALLVMLLFIICLWGISMVRIGVNIENIYLYGISSKEDCLNHIAGVERLGGWVEELDTSYHVSAVYGEKKTDIMEYSQDAVFDLISGHKSTTSDYIGFINKREDSIGYYLVQYARKDIDLSPTIMYSPENSDSTWNSLFVFLFFSMFIGTCFLMGTYLSRRIRRPLTDLSSAMSRVKNEEDAVILDFKAEAEFAEIRDAFNIMARSLTETRREKEEAEARKNKMLLELSHDIRTPISTINSLAVALEQDLIKEEDKHDSYQTIRMKAGRVTSLTDDMFTMLKMKSSEYQIQKSSEDICEFLRRQCGEFYQDAQDRGMELTADIPEGRIYYEADYILLARVIGNLLTNALKYNQSGKLIEVRLEKEQEIKIWISDDGEPIADEVRNWLFDDFTRGDRARKSDGGTGLGLSIAKAILEKHGGSIGYKYENRKNHFIILLESV